MALSKQNLIYIQDELNRRFNLLVDTPIRRKETIFFVRLYGYMDWIVKNKTLRKILDKATKHNPEELLYYQGKNLNKVFHGSNRISGVK